MASALWHPSPNVSDRRDGATEPRYIVIHYTAMTSAEDALERLCDPAFEVSAHYLIGRAGTVWQLVSEDKRAWHAGAGTWAGCRDLNSHSIGIELDNDGTSPFAAPLMDSLEALLRDLMTRWAIPASGLIGHSDLAPDRKLDPGARFDWRRLARQGFAHWHDAPPTESHLKALGYAVDRFGLEACAAAYRIRYGLPPIDASAPEA